MDQRGRKSSAAASLHVVHLPGQWPEPPERLTPSQATMWESIVVTKPHDWFGPDTYPLLVEYIRATEQADVLAKQLEDFDPEWLKDEDGLQRYEKLNRLADAKASSLARLATKMRLSQQSRYSEKAAHTASKQAGSAQAKPWHRRG